MSLRVNSLLIISLIWAVSCQKNDDPDPRFEEEIASEVIAEFIDDDIEKIVLSQVFNFYQTRGVSADAQTHPTPNLNPYEHRTGCAVKSTTNNNSQVMIDYGSGCRDDQKRVRAGKIIANLSEKKDLVFGRIDIILENYYYESVLVTGTRTIIVNTETTRQYADIESNISDGLLTFDDGSSYTYNAQRAIAWDFSGDTENEFYFAIELNKSGIDRNNVEFESTSLSRVITHSSNFESGIGQITGGMLRRTTDNKIKSLDFKGGTAISVIENDEEPYSLDLSSLFINS
jgi:hypothetical protein